MPYRFFPSKAGRISGISMFLLLALFLFGGCSASSKKQGPASRSMESIYEENGVPVRLRTVALEPFAAYLKYPATLKARLESAATASLSEVVRKTNAQVGDYARKDEVIVALSGDNANYQQAKAAFETAEATYARYKAMFESSDISPQDFDNVKVQYAQAKAAFKTMDDIVNVKAPIDGYITRLDAQVSDNVYPGAPLFTVSNLDSIDAKLYVANDEARTVKTGQAALIEEGGQAFRGEVTQVSLIMDPQRKAIPVTASFANRGSFLTGGITTDVSLEVYRSSAIVVKQKEILRQNDTYYAFVVEAGIAKRRELKFGRRDGLSYEVLAGLEPGEKLVVEGAQSLGDGVKVRLADAPASSN
jgi:membrane fusion protein, multidrug efflux system